MDISALDSAEEGNSMNRKGRGRCGEWLWLPKRGVGARHPDGGAQQGAAVGEAEVEVGRQQHRVAVEFLVEDISVRRWNMGEENSRL